MADVFISYSRGDEPFAARLAHIVEQLGLSVWWDRHLENGAEWEMRIEQELDAAKAVVVIWSAESVKSLAVRAEAQRSQRQGKLAPIRIQKVEPPLFSSGIQFEDFTDWQGETSSFSFQDLWRQLVALCDSQAAAQMVPRDGVTPIGKITEVDQLDLEAPVLKQRWFNRPVPIFDSVSSLLEFLVVAVGATWLLLNQDQLVGTYWNAIVSAAIFTVVMFNAAEARLSKGVKAIVARWLRPQPEAAPLRSAAAFLAMFEAVFGKAHLSWRCFFPSVFASVALYAGLLLMLLPGAVLLEQIGQLLSTGVTPPQAVNLFDDEYLPSTMLETNAALLFVAVPIANIIVDYLSLWQTRTVLHWASRKLPLPLAVVIDAVLTGAVFALCLPLGPVAFFGLLEAFSAAGLTADAASSGWNLALEIWRSLWLFVSVGWPGEFLSAIAGEGNLTNTSILVAFVTTFTTSMWLWAALIFAPVVRFVSWSHRRGLSFFGRVLNTSARPIAPLGYVSGAFVILAGILGSFSSGALEAHAASGSLEPGSVFRDCDVCPQMVAIPGGSYWIGSPEDEEGREPRTVENDSRRMDDVFEGPQTQLTISPFSMGRFEVTFREWDACARDVSKKTGLPFCRIIPRGSEYFKIAGSNYTYPHGDQGWGRGYRPVITVSWYDAQAFVAWLNSKVEGKGVRYSLPSEAQWEYAARANINGSDREPPYHFGSDVEMSCEYANVADFTYLRVTSRGEEEIVKCNDQYPFTSPVGAYRPNAFGLYDMYGNVEEWLEDCFHESYTGRPTTGEAWRDGCKYTNENFDWISDCLSDAEGIRVFWGSDSKEECSDTKTLVLRGGTWTAETPDYRSAGRVPYYAWVQTDWVGFRVVRQSL